jgi:DNA-binding winged helix-turn-helix (wHTH) protein/Tol biopolymer transport system component
MTLRFSDFEADLRAGELRKQGVKIKLQEQPFQVLQILLEQPGDVVSREELQRRIWPADTFVDFDHGLYNAIKRLREALGDSAESPRFIETLSKRGYRFVGDVNGNGGLAAVPVTEVAVAVADKQEPSLKKWVAIAVVPVVVVVAAVLVYWWIRQPAIPVIETVTQLTDDGVPKKPLLATDGSRIYFNEGDTGSWNVAQVSVVGGETSMVPTRLVDPQIMGIAPDGTSLLAFVGEYDSIGLRPLWAIPLPAGEPRRLGSFEAMSADFFPDGRLIFGPGSALYVADREGLHARRVLTAPGIVSCPRVSPNGKTIVFWSYTFPNAMFEAAADGSALHEIMRSSEDASFGCPNWTRDGKYVVYTAVDSGRLDIWAVAVRTGFSGRFTHTARLTNGPLSYQDALPSLDGKHIYAIGTQPRGEIVRYDRKTKQFVPFLGGISAVDLSFSRDGEWVAYTSYVDHTLWRSRADGTDRVQLTHPPMQVSYPIIGPNGKQIVFMTPRNETYVIDMAGTSLRKIADKSSGGALSPDGNSIAFTAAVEGIHEDDKQIWQLKTLDLRAGAPTDVPGSRGMLGVVWITQDMLVAATGDFTKLRSFSFKAGEWTDLVSGAIVNWMPSPDGKYLYYTTGGAEPKAMRVRFADRKIEEIMNLKGLRRVVDPVDLGTQISVAPDGSPVFTRDLGTQEIYSLTVKWPQ